MAGRRGQTEVDIEPMLKSLRKLDDRGRQLVDMALQNVAEDEAQAAAGRAPGSIGRKIRVYQKAGLRRVGHVAFLIGVEMSNANDRVGNWINYGTLGKRPKRKTRKPGTKYGRTGGIKPRRFIRQVSKAKRLAAMLEAVKKAARDSGFDVR